MVSNRKAQWTVEQAKTRLARLILNPASATLGVIVVVLGLLAPRANAATTVSTADLDFMQAAAQGGMAATNRCVQDYEALAAREAIASTKEKELLSQSGGEFELTLLLTQTEALSYAWDLAKVAGEHEPQPERSHALAGRGEDMQNLYHDVFVLLLAKIDFSLTNAVTTHSQ